MTELSAVRTTADGPVLHVVLDRPKANAIDAATSRELSGVFVDFRDDPDLRVAVLTGVGDRFFSAGWDLGRQPTARISKPTTARVASAGSANFPTGTSR